MIMRDKRIAQVLYIHLIVNRADIIVDFSFVRQNKGRSKKSVEEVGELPSEIMIGAGT